MHWWDREEHDPQLVRASALEALDVERAAATSPAPVGGAGRWRFTLGASVCAHAMLSCVLRPASCVLRPDS